MLSGRSRILVIGALAALAFSTATTATNDTTGSAYIISIDPAHATGTAVFGVAETRLGLIEIRALEREPILDLKAFDRHAKRVSSPAALAPARDNRAGAVVLSGPSSRMAWQVGQLVVRDRPYEHPLRCDLGARSLI